MRILSFLILGLIIIPNSYSQSLNLNESFFEEKLRNEQLLGEFDSNISFSIRPIDLSYNSNYSFENYYKNYIINSNYIKLSLLPVNLKVNYNSHHPYNRNNGIMIPARGYQKMISLGFFLKVGAISIQLKPEYVFAENKKYDGFWEGHYPLILSKRYQMWNLIDTPEMFGSNKYNEFFSGQSYVKLNLGKISIGLSSEDLWWGPCVRNGIMMSNQARGFLHYKIETNKPLKTFVGNFEFQLVTGRLEASEFIPSFSDFKYADHGVYVPKKDDWRFFQGFVFTYNPKPINGLSIGFIRWVQAYSEVIKRNKDYLPAFDNLLRKNDKYGTGSDSIEGDRDQGAGVFLRWLWPDSNAEIYAELHYNDSKANFRDLLLDSDHSRAATIGINKLFKNKLNKNYFQFNWEWTQLEQTSSRLLRNAGSWYMHYKVRHGYTNRGEVLGAGIGPGSNSHYFSFSKNNNFDKYGIAIEIVDNDNDFLYWAFEDAKDFRRYWKDYNLHLFANKKFNKFYSSLRIIYSRSLNYQWALDESSGIGEGYEYYVPGIDVNNFHLDLNITIPLSF